MPTMKIEIISDFCLFEFEPFYEDGLVTVQRVVLSITFSGHEI